MLCPTLEPSRGDGSYEGSQHMLSFRNKKKYLWLILNSPSYLLLCNIVRPANAGWLDQFWFSVYNHANLYRFEETSSYWSVKRISVFLCFWLVNQRHTSGITVTVQWPIFKTRGEPGLVDRVLALYAGSRGFDSHRGHMSERFSRSIDQDIRTQWALSWKIVVSEWRSVIAVALNVGGGVRLIKPAKLCMCTQNTTNTTRTDARRRVCAAMVPYHWVTRGTSLRELEYTHTHTFLKHSAGHA